MKNEFTLRHLAAELPARVNAARHSGIDCVRLTLAEAQAIRALLPVELEDLDAKVKAQRKLERSR